jgi:DNA-binding YbaB/EbfC family protein
MAAGRHPEAQVSRARRNLADCGDPGRIAKIKVNEMKGPLAGLMQQAQRMQEDMKRAQEEIAQLEVSGQAGGGLVSVLMSGRHEVRRVTIDRKLFADDPEMAEDLVAAAVNDAVNKVAAISQEKLGGVTAGMNLPAGLKLPF